MDGQIDGQMNGYKGKVTTLKKENKSYYLGSL